jgi:hypothetical protein
MVWSTVGAKPAVVTWHCLRMMTEVGFAVGSCWSDHPHLHVRATSPRHAMLLSRNYRWHGWSDGGEGDCLPNPAQGSNRRIMNPGHSLLTRISWQPGNRGCQWLLSDMFARIEPVGVPVNAR